MLRIGVISKAHYFDSGNVKGMFLSCEDRAEVLPFLTGFAKRSVTLVCWVTWDVTQGAL